MIALFAIVPRWCYGLLLIVALAIGIEVHGQHKGAARIQKLWDADLAKAEAQAETLRLMRQASIDKRETKSVVVAVKKREIVQSNLAKIDQYAPTSYPALPGSIRLWHDAAATGKAIDDTGKTDGSAVSLTDLAATTALNYAACLDDQSRLTDLQAIIRTLTGAPNGKDEVTK